MEPPVIHRERLVRDYCAEEAVTPPRNQSSNTAHRPQEQWSSPPRNRKDVILEEVEPPDEVFENTGTSVYEPSVSTQVTSVSGSAYSRPADFFSREVFQVVLHNPTTAHQLKKFAHSRLCGENLDFLDQIDQYHHLLNQVTKVIFDIHRNYISVNSPSQVNLPDNLLVQINTNLRHLLAKIMPNMESVFLAAQNDIERLVSLDIYPRFVRYQMTMSATRALATNKNKYAGLGDCFVLTNPNLADNPIVYASDGFVKVTGYNRNEIIPRNCRFLQTNRTDRESVRRIKKCLDRPAECVELLLNQRKDGEPFWNLLYTTPLYDSAGRVSFFLGGQINVSTTIHNTSDVLRILSANSDDPYADANDDDTFTTNRQPPPSSTPAKPHHRSSFFFSGLRKQKPAPPPRTPGMEPNLLENMDALPFTQQKEVFYTAYSKYIIVDPGSTLISFHSAGIARLFYPPPHWPAPGAIPIVGQDVFKFLSYHSASGLSRDYKTRVKNALKGGMAVSLDLSLSTRRVAGFERFVTHWTPLKDDAHAMGYVVLTFGSEK